MPQSWTKPTVEEQPWVDDGDRDHYFDSAHGDVAALHARIEQGYMAHSVSPLGNQVDTVVRRVSRYAGVVGLLAALAGIAWWLI